MKGIRWGLLVPAVLAAWYGAVLLGIQLLFYVESRCPPSDMVSGMCTANWYPAAEKAVFCFATALSAVAVVLTAALVAPQQKNKVAWGTFFLGAIIAVYWGIEARAWLELVATLSMGGLTTVLIQLVAQQGAPADRLASLRSARGG